MLKAKKKIIWVAIIILIGAGVYYFVRSKKAVTEYTTEKAIKGDLVQTVSVTGEVTPKRKAEAGFEVSGQVSQIFFEVGDRVKKGDKIAQIKAGTFLESLNQARKALEAQKQTYLDMKEKRKVFSSEQRRAQRAVVEQYQSAVRQAEINLYKTSLFSPIDGIIAVRNIEVGKVVNFNEPSFIIIGEDGMEIRADVPETDIVKVLVGQLAELSFDALPSNEKIAGRVVKIDPSATIVQDVVYYRVTLDFENDSRLKPGMSVDVDIKTAQKNNVVMIPLRAVRSEQGKEFVEILKKSEKGDYIEKIYVTTGLRGNEGMVEILSGLAGGENVVTLTKSRK